MHIASLARAGVSLKLTKKGEGEGGKMEEQERGADVEINRGSGDFREKKKFRGCVPTRTQLNKSHYTGEQPPDAGSRR